MPLELQKNTLQPGHKLLWYTIERVLGHGGFGITYLALDTNLDQNVAIKEFLPSEIAVRSADFTIQPKSESHKGQYESLLVRFLLEAKTLARFDHPNIVRVFSVFEANCSAYIVMRFEQGKSLSQILQDNRFIPEERLKGIVLPILDGLSNVHKQGFIHRDIQPANIYIREDDSPVLLDFGSARQAIGDSRTLTILVAPGYAPFEQYYSSGSEQGPWSDIYGMGATLYRVVAGVAPIDAIERSKGMLGSTRDVLAPAKIVGKGRYSDQFLSAIDHALEFNEKDRPQTVMEWVGEILGESTNINEQPHSPKQTTSHEIELSQSEATNKITSTSDKIDGWSGFLSKPMLPRFSLALLLILTLGIGILIPGILEKNDISFSRDDASKSKNENMAAIMESQMGQANSVEEKLSELQAQLDNEMTRITTLQYDVDSLHSEREEEEELIKELQEKRQQAENELSQVKNELQQAGQEKIRIEQEKKKIAEQKKIRVEQEKKKIAEQKKIRIEQEKSKTELDNQKEQESVVEVPAKIKLNPLDEGIMAYKQGLYTDALRILAPLAKEGNPIAQYIIATLYREGRGVLSNNALALKWMRKAASQGNKEAQVDLARMYSNGIDGKQDPFLAYTWYLVAERNGTYFVAGEMKKVEALLQTEQFSQALALAKDIGKENSSITKGVK